MGSLQVSKRPGRTGPSPQLLEATSLSADPRNAAELWESFDRFYVENERAIMEASQTDVVSIANSRKALKMESAMGSFLENSKIILQGLHFLSEIHPALGAAVGAFSAVIKIEIIRRDNNAKAMSVKIQMQNLMCALFQIRLLRTDQHDFLASERLAHLMTVVAEEIKACGSDLSYYQDKKLISRLIHATFFEQRLAQHIATFAERRSELDLLIASYTAGRVNETANIASRVEYKLDSLVSILQRLETPREKEAVKFIELNGGVQNCIEDDDLLSDLLTKTGNPVSEFETKSGEELKGLKDQLRKELKEDIEQTLNKNLANFDAMLRIQNNNMKHMSHAMENHTSQMMKFTNEIAMFLPGLRKHVLLTDPILQKIWMEMGLRQSVKAKKFVLTFKDYHARLQPRSPMILATPNVQIVELPPSADLESGFMQPINESETVLVGPSDGDKDHADSDEWALNYIDVVHLDPIVEAIDDDFSGFISIHEANRFAVARPKQWSLLRWFAYWAAGWALSIDKYKNKILNIVEKIYEATLVALPCNKAYIGDYLDGLSFRSLDTLLRSTQPLIGDTDRSDSKLAELVADMDGRLEERLLSNLKDLKFVLGTEDKVTLVTGPGRIERYAFPLLYLILRHHYHVVRLAAQYRLCSSEMYACSSSLLTIISALRSRADHLEAVFRQKSKSVQDPFKKFSFGMLALFKSTEEYKTKNDMLLASHLSKTQLESDVYSSAGTPNDDDDSKVPGDGSVGDAAPKALISKWTLTDADLEALKMFNQALDHPEDRPEVDVEQVLATDYSRPSPGSSTPPATSGESEPVPDDAEGNDDETLSRTRNLLGGLWTGRLYRDRGLPVMQKDVIAVRFDVPSTSGEDGDEETARGNEFTGAAELLNGQGVISGRVVLREYPAKPAEDEDDTPGGTQRRKTVGLELRMEGSTGLQYLLTASIVDGNPDCWVGAWSFLDYPGDTGIRPFELWRRPPEAFRFIHLLDKTEVDGGRDVAPSSGAEDDSTKGSGASASATGEGDGANVAGEVAAQASAEGTVPADAPPPTSTTEETDAKAPTAEDSSNADGLQVPSASARWKFALAVVLYQVQQRLHSKSFYLERAKERKRWIWISMRLSHSEHTEAEFCEFLRMRAFVHPNVSSVWERIARFYLTRKVAESVTSYVNCDVCGDQYCFVRYLCITCQQESMNNQVDICAKCLGHKDVITTSEFTHRPSHTLLKSNRRILNMEHAYHVTEARVRAKRVKQSFRVDVSSHRHGGGKDARKEEVVHTCGCCKKEVQLPCWVCATCPHDVLVCMDCEVRDRHDRSHPLLRIVDDVEVESSKPTGTDQAEKYLLTTKQVLGEQLGSVNARIDKLAEQVDKIQQAVAINGAAPPRQTSQGHGGDSEAISGTLAKSLVNGEGSLEAVNINMAKRMDALERDVNKRLLGIEELLRQVLVATSQKS